MTVDDWRQKFHLPSNYCIDGFLNFGSFYSQKQEKIFFQAIKKFKIPKKSTRRLERFLDSIIEFKFDHKTYWYNVAYGGTRLSENVHLACLFGSQKNILLGSCGNLHPDIKPDELIIPDVIWGNESTTRIYQEKNPRCALAHQHRASQELIEKFTQKLTRYKINNGSTTTCQAMLGESMTDIQSWQKTGYFGVEMEGSTVLAVSNHFEVPAVVVLQICEDLANFEKVEDTTHMARQQYRQQTREELYRVALEILLEK